VKLQTEIQQLEADKEKLPERIAKIEADLQELRNNLFDIWAKKAAKSIREDASCPQHGHTMGIVFKCKVCSYELGLGWGRG
jgi:septal ring factor EnvC (AmiA/AmiB activator)